MNKKQRKEQFQKRINDIQSSIRSANKNWKKFYDLNPKTFLDYVNLSLAIDNFYENKSYTAQYGRFNFEQVETYYLKGFEKHFPKEYNNILKNMSKEGIDVLEMLQYNQEIVKPTILKLKDAEISKLNKMYSELVVLYDDFNNKQMLSLNDYKRLVNFKNSLLAYRGIKLGDEVLLEGYRNLSKEDKELYNKYEIDFSYSTQGKFLVEFLIKNLENDYAFNLSEEKYDELKNKYDNKVDKQKEKIENLLTESANLYEKFSSKDKISVIDLEKLKHNLKVIEQFGNSRSDFVNAVESETLKKFSKKNDLFDSLKYSYGKLKNVYKDLNKSIEKEKNPRNILKY